MHKKCPTWTWNAITIYLLKTTFTTRGLGEHYRCTKQPDLKGHIHRFGMLGLNGSKCVEKKDPRAVLKIKARLSRYRSYNITKNRQFFRFWAVDLPWEDLAQIGEKTDRENLLRNPHTKFQPNRPSGWCRYGGGKSKKSSHNLMRHAQTPAKLGTLHRYKFADGRYSSKMRQSCSSDIAMDNPNVIFKIREEFRQFICICISGDGSFRLVPPRGKFRRIVVGLS